MGTSARRGVGDGAALVLLLALTWFAAHAQAQTARTQPAPPKTLVLLVSNMDWADVQTSDRLQAVRDLAASGSVALLNTAVSGEATEAAAYLSVGASERIAAPAERGPTIPVDEVSFTIADIAAEVYPASGLEGNAVRPVYFRRFGIAPPSDAVVVAIGLPTLQRIQPDVSRANLLGALGDALRTGGRQVAAFGDWRAALVAMDRKATVYHGSAVAELTPALLPTALREADAIVTSVKGTRALRLLITAALPLVQSGQINLLAASVSPPTDVASGKWNRLGWVVAAGPAFPPSTLLVSATTRTPGLIANVDLAPTILALQGLPPFPGGAGHAVRAVASPNALGTVDRLDRQTIAATSAALPLCVGYGILAIGTGLVSLICLRIGIGKRIARFALLVVAAVLIALLPVGYLAPVVVWQYGLSVLALSVALALAADLVGKFLGVSPIGLIFAVLAAAICIDAAFGSPLVATDLLSGFYLAGIRFYGLGNEYTGFLLGAALTGWGLLERSEPSPPGLLSRKRAEGEFEGKATASSLPPLCRADAGMPLDSPSARLRERGPGSEGLLLLVVLALLTTLLIGLPWCGADAGGALAATVAFTLAIWQQRRDQTLQFRAVIGAFAAAFVVVILLALLDRAQGAGARTHIGGAIAEGQSRGFGAIWDIIVRKLMMNIGISSNHLTLAVIAGMIPIWLLLTRGAVGERVRALLASRPALRGVVPALLWGAFAAAVFNDSGVAMALMLLAPPTVAVIHEMLSE